MSLSITPTSLLNTSRVADSVIQCSKSQDDPSKYSVQEVLFCFALVLWTKKFLDQIEAWGVKRYSLFLFVQSCQVWWQSSSLNRIKTQKKNVLHFCSCFWLSSPNIFFSALFWYSLSERWWWNKMFYFIDVSHKF